MTPPTSDLPAILRWEADPIQPNAYRLSNGFGSYERRGNVWHWSAGRDYGTAALSDDAKREVIRRLDPGTWVESFEDYYSTADYALHVSRCGKEWEFTVSAIAPTRDAAMAEALRVLAVARRGAP
jgi:hypothetical protein